MNLPVPARPLDDADRAGRLADAWLETHTSPHTRRAYQRDIVMWLDWCADHGIDPIEARHAHTGTWIAGRAAEGDSEPTRARRLSTVSSWYRWLLREGAVAYNPADLGSKQRPKARRQVSPTAVLAPDQTAALLAAADADRNPRTAALVSLLVDTGCRIDEILSADIEDIAMDRGRMVLHVVGKGRRERPAPLPSGCYERLTRYLDSRTDPADRLPALAAGARPRRPLMATGRGGRVDQAAVWRLLRRLGRKAGLPDEVVRRISAHSLRHSYATDLLGDGVPVRDVQYAMGHADPRTTEYYDHGHLDPDRHPNYRRAALMRGGSSSHDTPPTTHPA